MGQACGERAWGLWASPSRQQATLMTGIVTGAAGSHAESPPSLQGSSELSVALPVPEGVMGSEMGSWGLTPGGTFLQQSSLDWERQRPPGLRGFTAKPPRPPSVEGEGLRQGPEDPGGVPSSVGAVLSPLE